jgi:hypothetical protein
MERIATTLDLVSTISERQKQRTREAFLAQPDRVIASETWRAMVADMIWQARSEVEQERRVVWDIDSRARSFDGRTD